MKIAIAAICFFCAGVVLADPSAYHCKVLDVVEVTDGGKIKPRADVIGMGYEFMVARSTGSIIGTPFANNGMMAEVTVHDRGSHDQAFKVSSVFGPKTKVEYLQVNEFVNGADKPFYGLAGGRLYSGLCK